MSKQKRPYHDETLLFPLCRHLYSRTALGRPGDAKEEPIKFTQTLHEEINYEAYQEWSVRFHENLILSEKFIDGELDEDIKALSKMEEWMDASGISGVVEDIEESGEAMEGVETAMGLAGDASTLEVMEGILAEDMFTSYGFHPPVVPLPIRLGPAVNVMLYGTSIDIYYDNIDMFTLEHLNFVEDYHFEEGVQTAKITYRYENIDEILERRHLRTGEKFRNICVQRPGPEGAAMSSDIIKDIRNERTSEYADDPLWNFPYSTIVIPDSNSTIRTMFDLIGNVMGLTRCEEIGWPFQCYTGWFPRPGIIELFFDLPVEMIIPRFIKVLVGVEFWLPMYTLTPLETTREVIGQEIVPPTADESTSAYIKYGMDRIRYPASFIQSKRAYGQDSVIRLPTEYPCPEKVIMKIGEAEDVIKNSRKEHPEWLTQIKGFGN